MRVRVSLPLLLLGLAAGAPTAASPRGAGSPSVDVAVTAAGGVACAMASAAESAAALRATNAARAVRGLRPLQVDPVLSRAAAAHACDMARQGRMRHQGSGSVGPGARVKALGYRPAVTAENIAAGPWTLAQALATWTGSSGHLANITIPQLQAMGVGSALAADGRTRFFAAVYAAPR